MPQIAGFRGALWDPTKVELAKVVSADVEQVRERIARGELVRDSARALYRYHQTFQVGGRAMTRKAMFAAIQLTPWSEGIVRPHEATDPKARDEALAGITAQRAHTEAVLAGYRDAAGEVDRVMRKAEDDKPTLEVTTADGTTHRLWRVSSAEVIGKVRPLFAPKKLHVLDGHARYEGMMGYQQQLGDIAPYSTGNFGLACLVNVEEPALAIAARHRVVRGGAKRDEVLDAAKKYFIVEKIAGMAKDLDKQRAAMRDTVAHQPAFVATFKGDADAWKLTLKPDVSLVTEGIQIHRALQKYDPVVIDQLFLAKCAPGGAMTTELDGAAALKSDADLVVIARPLAIEQVLHADELGQVLPFGSTAFMPAVANLIMYLVEADEDVV